MTRLTPILLAAAIVLAPSAALAGPTEDAFLAKLPGIWKGKGTITGAETGKVDCTLTDAAALGRRELFSQMRCVRVWPAKLLGRDQLQ